jgi:uncharacterized protein YpmB
MKTQTIIIVSIVLVAITAVIAYVFLKPKPVENITSSTTQTGGGSGLLSAIGGLFSTKAIANALTTTPTTPPTTPSV